MSTIRLDSWRAWRQSWVSLSQHPWPLLGFSGAVLALHLLGWALFAVAEGQESAVLSALLHLLGLGLYSASLLWMVEGLSRGGLAIARQQPLRWQALWRWRGRRSWRLLRSLAAVAAATAGAALMSFALWSLLLLLLPSLSLAAALLGVIGTGAVLLSQLFGPLLVIDGRMNPSASFRTGAVLLEHHWPGLLLLVTLLLATLLGPLVIGLLAEALMQGLGVAATALACVVSLPLVATAVAHAYLQLQPELALKPGFRRGAR